MPATNRSQFTALVAAFSQTTSWSPAGTDSGAARLAGRTRHVGARSKTRAPSVSATHAGTSTDGRNSQFMRRTSTEVAYQAAAAVVKRRAVAAVVHKSALPWGLGGRRNLRGKCQLQRGPVPPSCTRGLGA